MSIRYVEAGAGPPMLLIPSPLLNARTYRPAIEAIADRHRVLAMDLPGSGRSSRLAEPWDFGRYADWSAQFLDAMGVPRAIVIGHSNSGAVALLMAADHPGRVERLVLIDTVGALEDRSSLRLLLGRAVDCLLEPWLNFWAGPDVLFNLAVHSRNALHQIKVTTTTDLLGPASRVRVPTLIAWAERDHVFPPACARRLSSAIPDSRLYFSRGSHDWLLLDPAEFARIVGRFVEDPGPTTSR